MRFMSHASDHATSSPNDARVSGIQVDREPPKNEKTFKINS